ncbi:hypothetical protein DKG78_01095 [Bacillus amyloliquefaciens]|uniref:hypothetical protein n=1 Tax=Bacillus amyloliquefaciens group TaxID=1938374 RepID=UPI001784A7B9|nr:MULTISPECIES: hypothetical protein [Bacillus amyloliquefaciens group]MEC2196345.1 hypothetical protein [Bacillus velezensis]QOH64870.1 hypothetical protein DKG78_01095 [Bacillus amyloliquefaciens]WFO91413.1 hypothetical protein JEQ23_01090 [Bacillus velezensis]WFO95500.1 hypothetical protein JEQ24_01090 [Bacillus velezensis]
MPRNNDNNYLKELYQDFNEWLKFSEAKNAGLLTFNGALLFGATEYVQQLHGKLSLGLKICLILLILNLLINLYSFKPSKGIKSKNNCICINQNHLKNLLFYKNLKDLNQKSLIQSLNERYDLDISYNDNYSYDLATQVLSIATLVRRKNKFFSVSSSVTILIVLLYIVLELI